MALYSEQSVVVVFSLLIDLEKGWKPEKKRTEEGDEVQMLLYKPPYLNRPIASRFVHDRLHMQII